MSISIYLYGTLTLSNLRLTQRHGTVGSHAVQCLWLVGGRGIQGGVMGGGGVVGG